MPASHFEGYVYRGTHESFTGSTNTVQAKSSGITR